MFFLYLLGRRGAKVHIVTGVTVLVRSPIKTKSTFYSSNFRCYFFHLPEQIKSIKWKIALHVRAFVSVSMCLFVQTNRENEEKIIYEYEIPIQLSLACDGSARVYEVCGVNTRVTIDSAQVKTKVSFVSTVNNV